MLGYEKHVTQPTRLTVISANTRSHSTDRPMVILFDVILMVPFYSHSSLPVLGLGFKSISGELNCCRFSVLTDFLFVSLELDSFV